MTKDEVEELRRRLYVGGVRRCNERWGPDPYLAADAGAAPQSNAAGSRADRLTRVAEAHWSKYGKPEERKPEPAKRQREVGPKTRDAIAFIEAVRRFKRGQAGQTMSPATEVHKLDPYVAPAGGA